MPTVAGSQLSAATPPIESLPKAPPAEPVARNPRTKDNSPLWDIDREREANADTIRSLQNRIAALESSQAQSQTAMQAAVQQAEEARQQAESRLALIESNFALQSTVIEEVKQAADARQQEQWRALDAISEAIDGILKGDAESPAPEPPPAAVGKMMSRKRFARPLTAAVDTKEAVQ
jgi:hypothetical protein